MTTASALPLAVTTFVMSTVLASGLELTTGDLVKSLRRRREVLAALAASFGAAPALAWALAHAPGMTTPSSQGLLILGAAGGAPFLPVLARLAQVDETLSVGLMVLLVGATILFMPLVLPLLIPAADVTAWMLARPLLVNMAAPLAAGVLVRSCWPRLAERLAPPTRLISGLTLVATVTLVFVRMGRSLLALTGAAAPAGVAFVVGTTAVGLLLGGPGAGSRVVQGLAAGTRNAAAALAVAASSFEDRGVLLVIVLVTLLTLVLLVPAARLWGRRLPPAGTAP